jgi:drug/metabolite transporter (DMT)-like permease
MLAFASNSILCRLALRNTSIDPASFTSIRLISGAVMLGLLVRLRQLSLIEAGNWWSAAALFIYAAGFSFAYISLPAASGALLLFGAVQITMIGYGIRSGEKLGMVQVAGILLAFSGLVGLFLPGLSAPPVTSSIMMLGAGVAWGIYSLRGREAGDPLQATAGNFWRAAIIAAVMSLLLLKSVSFDTAGVWYAIASGALTSGIGYAIWYTALPGLKATQAASVQLSVPVLAALGGIVLLGEPLSLRLVLASAAILGGIALVIKEKSKP